MVPQSKISGFKKPIAYKIGGAYGGTFLYIGIVMPFWALWLAQVGMTPAEIGFLIGFPSFLKVLTSPFIAQLCDKWGMVRRPMLVLLALASFFFCGYFFFRNFSLFVIVTGLFSIAFTGFIPLLESYAVRACDKHDLQYGRLRSVGSIVFIITSVLFGKYLDHFGYGQFIYFCVASLVLTFFAVFLLPGDRKKQQKQNSEPADDMISPVKVLLTSREFIMFLVVISLIQMSHGLIYVMGSYHWAAQGIDNKTIGLLWSIGVFAEILIFIFAGQLVSRIRPMYILAFIGFFGAIRWFVLGSTVSLPLLIIVQTFHGLTYGAAHLVAMYYLSSRVPDKYFTTAQSLYSSIPLGLSQGAVMILSGPLYNAFGGQAYFVMAILCVMVLFMAKFVRRVSKETSSEK